MYGCPCSNVSAVKFKFIISHYSKKWLYYQKFEELYLELRSSLHVRQTYKYSVVEANIDEDVGNKVPSDDTVSQNGDLNLRNIELTTTT